MTENLNQHTRGQITLFKDLLGDMAYRVYTGCKILDDYYVCTSAKDAQRISDELRGESR